MGPKCYKINILTDLLLLHPKLYHGISRTQLEYAVLYGHIVFMQRIELVILVLGKC